VTGGKCGDSAEDGNTTNESVHGSMIETVVQRSDDVKLTAVPTRLRA
jgi:hypothetical protein